MKRVTRTIKLKFPQLNKTKEQLFEEMTAEATDLANRLLTIPLAERRKLTIFVGSNSSHVCAV
ncbi:MAG: hypothetical protein KME49_25155 [Brasilonema octagenarum HA4186-MV1]|nr:hypothetical protein [Brasilonema octagenarum HA4186-MV1]